MANKRAIFAKFAAVVSSLFCWAVFVVVMLYLRFTAPLSYFLAAALLLLLGFLYSRTSDLATLFSAFIASSGILLFLVYVFTVSLILGSPEWFIPLEAAAAVGVAYVGAKISKRMFGYGA